MDTGMRFTGFIRSFLNATFKTNACMERGIMTGITRVSKESIFSDLNNLNVVTTTSDDISVKFWFYGGGSLCVFGRVWSGRNKR